MGDHGNGLPVYEGPAKECTFCERPFKSGDMVLASGLGMAFCYKGKRLFKCIENWHEDNPKVDFSFKPMEFPDDGSLGDHALI